MRFGNVTTRHALKTLFLAALHKLQALPRGYRITRWLYGAAHRWLRRAPDPHGQGTIRFGEATPDIRLGLEVGDLVRVRPRDEIYATVNFQNRNRGLQIDEEMTRFCGGEFRVRNRVAQIVNEQTGQMMYFKNPCIVLDGVNCEGHYSAKRLLCPRRITAYWREIWLERAGDVPAAAGASQSAGPATPGA